MDGVKLLAQARRAGLEVRAEGERLVIRGLKSQEALALELIAHKPEIMALLLAAAEDSEVTWRVEAMRPQVPSRGLIPFLVARHDPSCLGAGFAAQPDCCLSCGDPLPQGNKYRCRPCERAAQQVVNEEREGVRP